MDRSAHPMTENTVTTSRVPALQTRGVNKQFGGTRALRSVDFRARKASVHALLGRNGSGKSTLIKVLAGYHHADAGCLPAARI